MKPIDSTAASKPRLLNQPTSFPLLLTIAVATSLFTFLFAQATLRVSETDGKIETTLVWPNATSARKQPRQEEVTYIKTSLFETASVPFEPKP